MSIIINIHPENPQERHIKKVVEAINSGAVIAYPTDSGYALGCAIDSKDAQLKIINIRKLYKNHYFTFMMPDLKSISKYGKINNNAFRLMKKVLPGPYTFILQATKNVPNRLLNSKRKTIGFRVPNNNIVKAILEFLDNPLLSASFILSGIDFYNSQDIVENIGNDVDIIIGSQHCPSIPTTVIDFSKDGVDVLREGAGNLDWLD